MSSPIPYLTGPTIILSPLPVIDSVPQDDAEHLQFTAIAASRLLATSRVQTARILLQAGTYTWLTPCDLTRASGITIEADPGAGIVSYLTPTGGPGGYRQSVFYAAADTPGPNSTVAVQPAIGSYTLEVADAVFQVGDYIHVHGVTNVAQPFQILAVSGATLTLDDAVEFIFAPGNLVARIIPPMGIRLIGNGASITGTGDRAIEMGSIGCFADGWRITRAAGSFTSIACSYDVGGRDNVFQNMQVDGGGVSAAGLALESQVRSSIRNSRTSYVGTGGANCGILVVTSSKFRVDGCDASKCYTGISIGGSSSEDLQACTHGAIVDCVALDCTTNGLITADGSDLVVERFDGSRAGTNGINVSAAEVGACDGIQLDGIVVNDCGGAGLLVGANGRVLVGSIQADRCAGYGIAIASGGSIVVVDELLSDDGAGPCTMIAVSNLSIGRMRARTTRDGSWYSVLTAGTLRIGDAVVEKVGSPTGVKALVDINGAATFLLENVCTIGALSFGVVANHGFAVNVARGPGVDISSCGIPWVFDSFARANFGQVALTGATPVAVAGFFPADAPVAFSFASLGGTQGAQPVCTAKAANSFSVKGTAGDTSTYDWVAR